MVYTIVVHLRAKPDAECISKLHAKLLEASSIYSKDHETLSWFVMQSKYHLENPYWKTFDPYVIPLLEKGMDLRRFEELAPAESAQAKTA
ncbi:hypothetical protein V1527DRAFT_479039 [Lipomyces starkeyi]